MLTDMLRKFVDLMLLLVEWLLGLELYHVFSAKSSFFRRDEDEYIFFHLDKTIEKHGKVDIEQELMYSACLEGRNQPLQLLWEGKCW